MGVASREASSGSKDATPKAGRWTHIVVSNVVDLGYSFRPVRREDFDERLRIIRVAHAKRLEQRAISRGPVALGTAYLVGDDPVAFYGADGTYYVRAT